MQCPVVDEDFCSQQRALVCEMDQTFFILRPLIFAMVLRKERPTLICNLS